MSTPYSPDGSRFLIELGPVRLPPEEMRRIGDEMLALVAAAIAKLDMTIAPPVEAERTAGKFFMDKSNPFFPGMPPGTYGYWFDVDVPGGPYVPHVLDIDRHPF